MSSVVPIPESLIATTSAAGTAGVACRRASTRAAVSWHAYALLKIVSRLDWRAAKRQGRPSSLWLLCGRLW